jgi:hypothetical protein
MTAQRPVERAACRTYNPANCPLHFVQHWRNSGQHQRQHLFPPPPSPSHNTQRTHTTHNTHIGMHTRCSAHNTHRHVHTMLIHSCKLPSPVPSAWEDQQAAQNTALTPRLPLINSTHKMVTHTRCSPNLASCRCRCRWRWRTSGRQQTQHHQ